ncbi:signal peptidase I [Alkalicoccus daliensis]|uniref:Signal peptidase I n=1 Tax=Alkalicoccus daliensis TaxID=745820 RepID=A0A1H0ETA7_9BACI|nr:signal peptidase I [Alkalicoccus daliensis]SDN85601.1 signal peptidase I [Alkalicoccus daliensis]
MAEEKKKGSWLMPIIVAVAVALLVRSFFIAPYVVEGASMEPSLYDRDRILVNKTTTWLGEFERGDVIIIEGENNRHYIKRVIALPGETLEMQEGSLYVEGEEIEEEYLEDLTQYEESIEEVTLPEDEYFVMGDNRNNSLDSRNGLGHIQEEDIVGRSAVVFYPFSNAQITN